VSFEYAVAASVSDAYEDSIGNVTLDNSTDTITQNEWVGFRFRVDLDSSHIPSISDVWLKVHVSGADDPAVNVNVEDADNSAVFTTTTEDVSGRTLTGTVTWDQTGIGSGYQDSPSLLTPFTDVLSRPGWSAGNYLTVTLDGTTAARELGVTMFEGNLPAILFVQTPDPDDGGNPGSLPPNNVGIQAFHRQIYMIPKTLSGGVF